MGRIEGLNLACQADCAADIAYQSHRNQGRQKLKMRTVATGAGSLTQGVVPSD